jgi:hypothetical protein
MKNRSVLITKSESSIAPISLDGIKTLIEAGVHIVTESHCYGSDRPCLRGLGCQIVDKSYWSKASHDTIIVGFDEVPTDDFPLTQQHFCFSSIFDSTLPPSNLLNRFFWGNGKLFDLSILLGHNRSYYLDNFSTVKEATLQLEKDFLPLLLDFLGEKKNPIWQEVEEKFNHKLTQHQPT